MTPSLSDHHKRESDVQFFLTNNLPFHLKPFSLEALYVLEHLPDDHINYREYMTAARLAQVASLVVVSSDSYGQYAARALASNTSEIAKVNLMEVLRKPSSHWYILCFPPPFAFLTGYTSRNAVAGIVSVGITRAWMIPVAAEYLRIHMPLPTECVLCLSYISLLAWHLFFLFRQVVEEARFLVCLWRDHKVNDDRLLLLPHSESLLLTAAAADVNSDATIELQALLSFMYHDAPGSMLTENRNRTAQVFNLLFFEKNREGSIARSTYDSVRS